MYCRVDHCSEFVPCPKPHRFHFTRKEDNKLLLNYSTESRQLPGGITLEPDISANADGTICLPQSTGVLNWGSSNALIAALFENKMPAPPKIEEKYSAFAFDDDNSDQEPLGAIRNLPQGPLHQYGIVPQQAAEMSLAQFDSAIHRLSLSPVDLRAFSHSLKEDDPENKQEGDVLLRLALNVYGTRLFDYGGMFDQEALFCDLASCFLARNDFSLLLPLMTQNQTKVLWGAVFVLYEELEAEEEDFTDQVFLLRNYLVRIHQFLESLESKESYSPVTKPQWRKQVV